MLESAFDALKSYKSGDDRKALNPIDDAIIASQKDEAARKELEAKLVAFLDTKPTHEATDFVCRKLRAIGTTAAVPALAKLLSDSKLSHLGRYALERIPFSEAGKALRDALPNLDNRIKIGVISSLGSRQEPESISALVGMLGDQDASVASAAAFALGSIRSGDAAQALADAKPADDRTKLAVTDASLACAEGLLSEGNKLGAMKIYNRFRSDDQPKHVRLAATRGLLACTGKSASGAQQ